MILPLLQLATVVLVAVYLNRWRSSTRKRNAQTWDSLLAQLQPDWSARQLSNNFLWKEGIDATADDVWQRMNGPRGLWVIFQNARVLVDMADFAARNNHSIDRMTIETLRSDALQIRVCVLVALAQYGLSQTSEGVRVNALRAATIYSGMAARMTALLQQNAASVLPDFVAAM